MCGGWGGELRGWWAAGRAGRERAEMRGGGVGGGLGEGAAGGPLPLPSKFGPRCLDDADAACGTRTCVAHRASLCASCASRYPPPLPLTEGLDVVPPALACRQPVLAGHSPPTSPPRGCLVFQRVIARPPRPRLSPPPPQCDRRPTLRRPRSPPPSVSAAVLTRAADPLRQPPPPLSQSPRGATPLPAWPTRVGTARRAARLPQGRRDACPPTLAPPCLGSQSKKKNN